ncbi:MAG: AbrB/MazE/SpoVT family DNA-binding domain-containing protein [Dermatophilaceae bacterium]
METTIDKAGRIVIPRELRAQVGLVPGEVRVSVLGAGILIEPIPSDVLVDDGGFLVIPSRGGSLTDDDVRALRLADQR